MTTETRSTSLTAANTNARVGDAADAARYGAAVLSVASLLARYGAATTPLPSPADDNRQVGDHDRCRPGSRNSVPACGATPATPRTSSRRRASTIS